MWPRPNRSAGWRPGTAQRAETVSTPLTLMAMAFIFGGLVAAAMPLSVAGGAIMCALVSLLAVTRLFGVSTFAQNIVTLLGLGLGIDYGLLAVYRFRELRGSGLDAGDAVARTVATAGRTITFSAVTIAISMCGLLFIPTDDMASLAVGGALVTVFAATAALTLLPALLGVAGPRIKAKPIAPAGDQRGWFARLARVVQRRPALLGGAALAVLLVLALPLLGLRTQVADERFLPAGNEARVTEAVMRERFPALAISPIVVVADANRGATLDGFVRQLRSLPGVTAVSPQIDPLDRTRPSVLLVRHPRWRAGPRGGGGGAARSGGSGQASGC